MVNKYRILYYIKSNYAIKIFFKFKYNLIKLFYLIILDVYF